LHRRPIGLQNVSAIKSTCELAAAAQRARPRAECSQRQYGQESIMSVFGSIVSAIFGSKHAANVAPSAGATPGSPASAGASAPSGSAASSGAAAGAAAAKPISREDVEAILKRLHDDQREDFDWRKSIVDLMKLLKLDSSLSARKQLAQELGYSGALDGSAEMNLWLHRQVMTKLAESGGKVPDSLKA
jgi:uncharacterized protein with von Willebrand factor type A (vWA) domain